jgi:hypothetical protein
MSLIRLRLQCLGLQKDYILGRIQYVLHWTVINNDSVLCTISTTETRKQVFLNGFQKQLFLCSLHFHVRYLPSIILNSDPIAGLLTQNT